LKGSVLLAWSFTNDRPIYAQISERITSAILSGEYAMGERLPSVRELADRAAVNPNTVQRAMGELETMGLVENRRTMGKVVTDDPEKISGARAKRGAKLVDDFLGKMSALGYDPESAVALILEKGKTKEEE